MINAYLFDLDGTLIDAKVYKKIYPAILKMIEKKLKIPRPAIEAQAKSFGLKRNKEGRYDSGELCLKLGLIDEYYDILKKEVKATASLKKDVRKVLSEVCKKGKKIGVVSNSMRRTINLYLSRYSLDEYVDFVFCIDDAGCKKEHYVFWEKLAMGRKLSPRTCIVIGDDKIDDVKTPAKAGYMTFHVKNSKDLIKVLDV